MFDAYKSQQPDLDVDETSEWIESIENIVEEDGPERARYLLRTVLNRARQLNVGLPNLIQSPYMNTIPPQNEPEFPGDQHMEKRIRRIIRWNAMAMVHRANKKYDNLGGHISTYASSASLYETGFNHFFRGPNSATGGDQVFIQGHAAPGIYARAFLEGRLKEADLDFFRRETGGNGLSSYPHPWLMPDFWQFPTVSMGLSPIAAIYQARFNRYIHNRDLKDTSDCRVWAFLGDGECDEPETLGALSVAAREDLNNLVFVVNCNLQRLDGPVRGNGKIIQELEAVFRGAGWHVLKVIWGPEWDKLLAQDVGGHLIDRMNATVDGAFQKFSVESGEYIRNNFFGPEPELQQLVAHLSNEELQQLRRGGHSYRKLYTAYKAATEHQDGPVAILAKTVKGWTLGAGFEASNATHQMKKLSLEQLQKFRDTIHLPIPDDRLEEAPYYHPGEKSPEVEYLRDRRAALGGSLPARRRQLSVPFKEPQASVYDESLAGSKNNIQASTTMAFVRLLRKFLRDKEISKYIVPIVPDESRTFGMDSLFREIGIYSSRGQQYEPVDSNHYLYYHESKTGQLLEEGITEAGSMASVTAAGTAYSVHNLPMIPFYIFYSMFGFQRTGDQLWAFGDSRGKGFILGATAGRTTLNGEGLQHEDGHSHLMATTIPNVCAYDPTYAYDIAVIIREGLRRMYTENESVFYYITLYNENYVMPPMPEGVEEGILRGIYRHPDKTPPPSPAKGKIKLLANGPILQSALEAQQVLSERFNIEAELWNVTSYQQLHRDGRSALRHNRLNPTATPRVPYIQETLGQENVPVIAVSDWVEELPSLISRFLSQPFYPLGTNGFGRSDTRQALRRHFEIDAGSIVLTALFALMQEGKVDSDTYQEARHQFDWPDDKDDPMMA